MNSAVYITKLYNANKRFYDGIRRTDETKNRRNNSFVKFLWLRGLYYKAVIDKNEDKYNEYYGKVKDAIFEIMNDGGYLKVCNFMKDIFENFNETHNNIKEIIVLENQF
jgi:glutathionylspermidine synthase